MKLAKQIRLCAVLVALGIAVSTWYYKPKKTASKRRRKRAKPIPDQVEAEVVAKAEDNPWYGYKRMAVICRRAGIAVTDRQVYRIFKKYDLFQKLKRKPLPELHQTAKLYELLPTGPNELWQTDITYIHVPGHGWWYAITVIDYYSRYLLALRFTHSYCAAEAIATLKEAREEAERSHGPLEVEPFLVTDNGTSFIARRFLSFVKDEYCHLRIQYRTPTQLGLLERFHGTLKQEEVYWRIYDSPQDARDCLAGFRKRYNSARPHWALIPEEGGDPVVPKDVYCGKAIPKIPRWQGWARDVKARLDEMLELQRKAS